MKLINRYLLLLTFLLVPLVNYTLPRMLAGGNQFSDDPATRVSPVGFAFAIWGVIFTGMLWYAIVIALRKEPESGPLVKANFCLILAGAASIAFVPISIYANNTVVFIDILAHLIPLIFAVYFLRQHVALNPSDGTNMLSRSSFFGPSMYLGWISAATVVSTSLMARHVGIELEPQTANTLTIATLMVLGVIAAAMIVYRDPIYGGTICWALFGVGVKQEAYPTIRTMAWVVAALVALVLAWRLWRQNRFYATASEHCVAESI